MEENFERSNGYSSNCTYFLTELREIVRTGIVSKCIRSELGAAPADTAKFLEGRRVYMSKVSKLITG